MSGHKPWRELNKTYRLWYNFGVRSPEILWGRFRNKHRPIFRLRMAWQRARRGYSDDQLWSLDHTLATLTVVGVERMREWQHGYPANLSSWREWDEILEAIQAGFQAWLDVDGWFMDDMPEKEALFKEGMKLYSEWFSALWD